METAKTAWENADMVADHEQVAADQATQRRHNCENTVEDIKYNLNHFDEALANAESKVTRS